MERVARRTSDSATLRMDVVPVGLIAVVLFVGYLLFDLRSGGAHQTLLTTKLTTFAGLQEMRGGLWLATMFALDLVLAVFSAALIVRSYRAIRQRAAGGGAAACSTGSTMLLGVAVFTCPGCTVPLLGTLGVTFIASTLPLGGLEFKLLGILVLAATWVWFQRRSTPAAVAR